MRNAAKVRTTTTASASSNDPAPRWPTEEALDNPHLEEAHADHGGALEEREGKDAPFCRAHGRHLYIQQGGAVSTSAAGRLHPAEKGEAVRTLRFSRVLKKRCVRWMLESDPDKRYTDSSSADVCSVSAVGLAGATGRGSDSTMTSRSTSFSVNEDRSLWKQKEYSPAQAGKVSLVLHRRCPTT